MNGKIFDIRSGRKIAAQRQTSGLPDLPTVPVMLETALAFDLQRQQATVDLNDISAVVLRDLGATVQIFREAASEFSGERSLQRIEDCIVGLGTDLCFEALSRATAIHGPQSEPMEKLSEHSRAIALLCRDLVDEQTNNMRPGDAYLVGLLHQIGCMPEALSWGLGAKSGIDPVSMGLALAQAWSLPHCVVEYFQERIEDRAAPRWADVVRCAHGALKESGQIRVANQSSQSGNFFEMRLRPTPA